MEQSKLIRLPFTREIAIARVRMAEDSWNSRDPARTSMGYSLGSQWRHMPDLPTGREEIVAFLEHFWATRLDYRLIKEMWAFGDNRIAVRFVSEWRDDEDLWTRTYGNENWEFDDEGLVSRRFVVTRNQMLHETERLFHWELGRRPDDHPSLTELGL